MPLVAAAEVYKWVDDKGQVHYSQTPPPGVKAEQKPDALPPSSAPNQDSLNRALEENNAAAPKRKEEADRAAQAQAQIQQQCQQARDQLAYMEAKTARRLGTTDDKGNVSRVTEEEFQARRAELQQVISERCT